MAVVMVQVGVCVLYCMFPPCHEPALTVGPLLSGHSLVGRMPQPGKCMAAAGPTP